MIPIFRTIVMIVFLFKNWVYLNQYYYETLLDNWAESNWIAIVGIEDLL